MIADLPGLIFTFVWDFADPADRAGVDQLTEPVRAAGSRVSFVELYTDQAARLAREGTQLRLEHKRGKRDVERSRRLSRSVDAEGRLNTDGDFYYPDAHLRLDNTDLSPRAAAEYIAAELDLSRSR